MRKVTIAVAFLAAMALSTNAAGAAKYEFRGDKGTRCVIEVGADASKTLQVLQAPRVGFSANPVCTYPARPDSAGKGKDAAKVKKRTCKKAKKSSMKGSKKRGCKKKSGARAASPTRRWLPRPRPSSRHSCSCSAPVRRCRATRPLRPSGSAATPVPCFPSRRAPTRGT